MTSGSESVVAHAPGRGLEISTNQPGIQFYHGKYHNGSAIGHTDTPYGSRLISQTIPNRCRDILHESASRYGCIIRETPIIAA
jgi:hypothetical protein